MQFFETASIWLMLAAILNLPYSTQPLNCDKEFTYFENYGQNGFNVSCNEISKGYEHMLENITISNEVSLSLTNSTFENLTSNIFSKLGKIKTLYIVNSKLNYDKKASIFTKLKRLETLKIENTNFQVYEATLDSLFKLRYLILLNNSLSKIEKSGFKSLENLEKLEISGNQIKSLEDLNLCELPKLKILRLQSNQITNSRLFSFSCPKTSNSLDFTINTNAKTLPVISKGTYFNISDITLDLVDLDLSLNQIVDLSHLLEGLNTLLRLNLGFNKINSIEYSSFMSVYKLEKLVVANNFIKNVETEVFYNKTNLKHLDLSYNHLTTFNLSNLQKLEFLDLGHNNLQNIYLKNLARLKFLNLDCNNLSNLEPQFFRKVPNLITLQLCGNKISLKRNFFKEVSLLDTLILKNNSLAFIPDFTFFGLRNLRILDLSVNKLSHLSKGVFSDLLNLETLNLSSNALETLEYKIVQPLRSLNTLDLTKNKLKSIEYDVILSNLRALSTIYIRENYLTCDVLKNMIDFVKKRGISFTVSETIDFKSENVAGIPCVDSLVKTAPIIVEKPAKGASVIFNLGIGIASVLVLLLIVIISYRAYIYLKRRMYKADEFELLDG